MADINDTQRDTYVRDSRYVETPRERGAPGALWFIVGGIVVALAVLFAVIYAGDADRSVPAESGTSITIESAPPAAAPAPEPEAAPAPQVAPAPDAAPAPAPAPAN